METSSSNIPALELKDVSFSYRGAPVLDAINLTLEHKSFVGLIGPNGAGKTTFLRIVLGLLKPESGSVNIFGKPPAESRGRIGYVPQYARFDADFPISLLDMVLMGRLSKQTLFRKYSKLDREKAEEVLAKVGLQAFLSRQIGKLSGGQLQRALIARALIGEPDILLLDEPTASLDTQIGQNVFQLLSELNERMTILLVSHDVGVISRHVKTIACLNRCLHYHNSKEITPKMLEEVYGCPVDLIAHGHAHRVLPEHDHSGHKHAEED